MLKKKIVHNTDMSLIWQLCNLWNTGTWS